jgi:hypothetical protein
MLPTYLVAVGSAAFAAIRALSWIYWVNHLDDAATDEKPAAAHTHAAA